MSQSAGSSPPTRSWLSFSTAVDVYHVGVWYALNPGRLPGDLYDVFTQAPPAALAPSSPPANLAQSSASAPGPSPSPVVISDSTPPALAPGPSPVPVVVVANLAQPAAPALSPSPAHALVTDSSPPDAPPPNPAPALSVVSNSPLAAAPIPGPCTELSVIVNSTPPTPPPKETDKSYNEFWRQSHPQSHLRQAAQLHGAEKVKNIGSKLLWGTLRLPYTVTSWLTNKVSQSAQTAITEAIVAEGVGRLIKPEPHTPLKNLRDCLHELSAKVSAKIEIHADLRTQTATAIDDFLADQKKYLEEAPDPRTSFRSTLFKEDEIKFRAFSQFLKENKSLNDEGPFVKDVFQIIETRWNYQQQFYVKKIARGLISKTPSSTPPAPGTAKKSEKNEKTRFFETLYQPLTNPVESKKKAIIGIFEEIEKLKSLGFKILLAFFILPKSTFHKSDETNGGHLASLIKKSENAIDVKDSNQIFQDLLFTELDNSDLNFLQKTSRKLGCWLLARPLLFFLNHVIERGKDELLYVIRLSTAERIKYINKILIEPGYEFMNMLETSYTFIAEQAKKGEFRTTVEKGISTAIAQIKVKNLTPKDLITKFVGSLMDRYLPSVNWAHTSSHHFDKRAKQATSVSKFWYYGWAGLSRVINFAATPWRWGIKKILHTILKKTAASAIHSFLQDSSESSQDFGKLALHSVYKTLLHKLELKNRTSPAPKNDSAKTSPALRQTVFVDKDIQDNISQLVSSFLKILYLQGSGVIDLMQKVSPDNNVEQTKKAAMGLAFVPLVQKATEQITEALQVFLEEESFSAVIFDVLADLEKQCLNFNSSTAIKGQIPLEQAFYTELQGAVKSGIKEAIDEKLDPSRRFQFEADLFVEGLKSDIFDFQTNFNANHTLTLTHIHHLEQTRKELLFDIFLRRYERAENSTNPSAMLHINAYKEEFFNKRKKISKKINDLVQLASDRDKIQKTYLELKQLTDSLSKATFPYKDLPITLQKIRNKTYPDSIQDSITKLQRALDSFPSEKLKKENESYLNGIVFTLKQLLDNSLSDNTEEDRNITVEIEKKYEEIQEKVKALADWAQQDLKCFECKIEEQQLDAFKQLLAQYGGSIQGGLSPLILNQLDAFFLFLGKNHNIKGLLWYVLKACLEINIPPEEFEKVIGKTKAKLEKPATPPAA